MIRKLIVLFLALIILGAFGVRELRQFWAAPLNIPDEGFLLTVSPGDSLRTVTDTLQQAGILNYPEFLLLYARLTGLDQQMKHGQYLLLPESNAESLLALLKKGDVIRYQVTLPEGITLAMAIDILAQQEHIKKTLKGPADSRVLDLVKPHSEPEGLFFPDSYQYSRGDTDWSILLRAHSAMNTVLQDEWGDRDLSLPYSTPYEALIMASIIERETGLPEERGQISGVFARRLEKGMLLQTDPTVIYGLGSDFDGNLQRKHLVEDNNSYNTYRHPGLPPTPIALPGRAAINAALHPDAGGSLFFVARGDGGHVFSETLSEHNRAVRDYQLSRRENYRSKPGKSQ